MKTAEEITHELLISSDTVGYQRSHVIQAMELYAEQFKTAWVDCYKEMPPDKRYVLVYVKERLMPFMSYRENGYWQGEFADVINNNTATHWTALPKFNL